MSNKTQKNASVTLEKDFYNKVRKIAGLKGMSFSCLVRSLLIKYMDRITLPQENNE